MFFVFWSKLCKVWKCPKNSLGIFFLLKYPFFQVKK